MYALKWKAYYIALRCNQVCWFKARWWLRDKAQTAVEKGRENRHKTDIFIFDKCNKVYWDILHGCITGTTLHTQICAALALVRRSPVELTAFPFIKRLFEINQFEKFNVMKASRLDGLLNVEIVAFRVHHSPSSYITVRYEIWFWLASAHSQTSTSIPVELNFVNNFWMHFVSVLNYIKRYGILIGMMI